MNSAPTPRSQPESSSLTRRHVAPHWIADGSFQLGNVDPKSPSEKTVHFNTTTIKKTGGMTANAARHVARLELILQASETVSFVPSASQICSPRTRAML